MGRHREFPPKIRIRKGGEEVKWGGKYYYLGPEKSEKASQRYLQLLAIWKADPFAEPDKAGKFTVARLCREFLEVDPSPIAEGERDKYRRGIALLLELHTYTLVDDFGPRDFSAWRDWLTDREPKLSRSYIRHLMRYIRFVWRWGVSTERVHPDKLKALEAVRGVRPGQGKPRKKLGPVNEGDFRAILPFLRPDAAGLLELLRYTGARPSELFGLKPVDVVKDGEIWSFTPAQHKTSDSGKTRVIYFGPKAKALLSRCAPAGDETPYFLTRRGTLYNRSSLRYTLVRLAKREGLKPISLYSLRRARLIEVRASNGLDAAQAIAGHERLTTTQIYAGRRDELAAKVAGESG